MPSDDVSPSSSPTMRIARKGRSHHPADLATDATTAFMVRHESGVLCGGMGARTSTGSDFRKWPRQTSTPTGGRPRLPYRLMPWMPRPRAAPADRTCTVLTLADPCAEAHDFARAGHLFPRRAHGGGVLKRSWHTGASVDSARLVGLQPAGLVNEGGTLSHLQELVSFKERHGLRIGFDRHEARITAFAQEDSVAGPPRGCDDSTHVGRNSPW
jgi:hypothetical protein